MRANRPLERRVLALEHVGSRPPESSIDCSTIEHSGLDGIELPDFEDLLRRCWKAGSLPPTEQRQFDNLASKLIVKPAAIVAAQTGEL